MLPCNIGVGWAPFLLKSPHFCLIGDSWKPNRAFHPSHALWTQCVFVELWFLSGARLLLGSVWWSVVVEIAILPDWWSSGASVQSSRIWVPTLPFAGHSIEARRGPPFLFVGWTETVQTVTFLYCSLDTVLYVKLKDGFGRTSLGFSNAWLSASFGGVLAVQHAEQGAPLPAPKQSAGKTEHKSVGA